MSESGSQPNKEKKQYTFNMALAAVTGQVGCLTVVIIIGALLLGLWLDNLLNSSPWVTLIMLIVSMPVTLYLMFKVASAATSRMVITPPEKSEETPQQEEELD